jgi:TolB-like protein
MQLTARIIRSTREISVMSRSDRDVLSQRVVVGEPSDAGLIAGKPSIAVLPLRMTRGPSELADLADDFAEAVTASLSRCASLFVTTYSSCAVFRGKQVALAEVGRDLGVRFILDGDVHSTSNGICVSCRLVEAPTEAVVWTAEWQGTLDEMSGRQHQIAVRILRTLSNSGEAEPARLGRKPPKIPGSDGIYLPGLATTHLSVSRLRGSLRRLLEQDVDRASTYAMLAYSYVVEQAISGVPLEDREEPLRLARLAIQHADDDAFALAKAAHVIAYLGYDFELASSLVDQALALDPNLAEAWFSAGWIAMMSGNASRSVQSFDMMLQLSPFDPARGMVLNGRAFALFLIGRYEEGRLSAEKACQIRSDVHTLCALAVNLVGLKRLDEARAVTARLLRDSPAFTVTRSMEAFPTCSAEHRDRFGSALEAAGLPL